MFGREDGHIHMRCAQTDPAMSVVKRVRSPGHYFVPVWLCRPGADMSDRFGPVLGCVDPVRVGAFSLRPGPGRGFLRSARSGASCRPGQVPSQCLRWANGPVSIAGCPNPVRWSKSVPVRMPGYNPQCVPPTINSPKNTPPLRGGRGACLTPQRISTDSGTWVSRVECTLYYRLINSTFFFPTDSKKRTKPVFSLSEVRTQVL